MLLSQIWQQNWQVLRPHPTGCASNYLQNYHQLFATRLTYFNAENLGPYFRIIVNLSLSIFVFFSPSQPYLRCTHITPHWLLFLTCCSISQNHDSIPNTYSVPAQHRNLGQNFFFSISIHWLWMTATASMRKTPKCFSHRKCICSVVCLDLYFHDANCAKVWKLSNFCFEIMNA